MPSLRSSPPNVLEYAKTMPGVSAPFPNIFDPADLLARAAFSPPPIKELNRWRESEITHGRVAMLASLGFIVQEQLQDYALFYNFDGKIKGPAIYHLNLEEEWRWMLDGSSIDRFHLHVTNHNLNGSILFYYSQSRATK